MFLLCALSLAGEWRAASLDITTNEPNWHFGKKIGKIVHSVTKPVEKAVHSVTKPVEKVVHTVTKPVEKVVHTVTKPVEKVVHTVTKPIEKVVKVPVKEVLKVAKSLSHSSKSYYKHPIRITGIETTTQTVSFTGETTDALTGSIVEKFGVDANLVKEIFSTAQFVTSQTSSLNSFKMDINESCHTQRFAELQLLGISYHKLADGKHQADVQQRKGAANVIADMTVSKKRRTLFWLSKHKTTFFRPLTSSELNQLYETLDATVKRAHA